MLKLDQVSKRYGSRVAVDALDLEVGSGELFGFIGPNGAGKTSTIRMLVGLTRPTSGTVTIAGRDVVKEPLVTRALVGYVPDEPSVHPKMTGRELLDLSCRLWSVDTEEIPRRVHAHLEEFGLLDVADRMAEGYSHGMLQKLCIAAALIHEPQVLVLDEPLVGLDPAAARLVKDRMRTHCERGNTVFFSTHVLEVAERLCSRVGVLSASHLVALGTPAELVADTPGATTLEEVFLARTS